MEEKPSFFDLPESLRDMALSQSAKARKVTGWKSGFSGAVAILDNGEGVFPRRVAAKMPKLKATIDPDEAAARFVREMKLQASTYYHPNVHWPFDFDVLFDVPVAFFRMWEGDLADFVTSPGLGDQGRLAIMVQVLAGLNHLHERGVCHQDLKPENIFVRDLRETFPDLPMGDLWFRPLIADFGSVNLASEKGIYQGTRPYMAPEQWTRQALSEKTSVFVAGIILYELVSRGLHPVGDSAVDWRARSKQLVSRWRQDDYWHAWLDRGCAAAMPLEDAELDAIVGHCLQVAPDARPSLSELQSKLIKALGRRSREAAHQVEFFLHRAIIDSDADRWPHLEARLAWLEKAVAA